MANKIVQVENVTKIYPLYDKKSDRLRESLSFSKKKRHKDFYALKNISFSVEEGESVGFVGKNGSGKSTLLKILTGVLTPTIGTFQMEGKISALLELGAGFNSEYTGIENIYLNGTIMGFTRAEMETKIDSILAFAEIGDFAYQPVKMYSSGMFVRLAFALAINVDPDILIVDEALSVGDIFFQQKCYKKFEDFKKSGKTILFVTHDMNSIIKYCNRAFLLHEGEMISEGNPKKIVDQYKKLIAGLDIRKEKKYNNEVADGSLKQKAKLEADMANGDWKQHYSLNQSALEYGEKELEIVDFGIFDEDNQLVLSCSKGKTYTICMKVKANVEVIEPIFAFSVKDIKGLEISGTNTFLEKVDTGILHVGDTVVTSFTQKIELQGTQFFISFGCTKFMQDGTLKVFHRLYDVIELSVMAAKTSVGWFDMNTQIKVQKEEANT